MVRREIKGFNTFFRLSRKKEILSGSSSVLIEERGEEYLWLHEHKMYYDESGSLK